MAQVFQQYRNQNAHRRYPFQDNASLVADGGSALPLDFIVDAFVYAIDVTGPIYLQQIDFDAHTLSFADAATNAVCGVATWSGTTIGSAAIYDLSPFQREVGMVIVDPSAISSTAGVWTFLAVATPLVPTCAVPLLQEGVRGMLAANDGQLVTGVVKLEGRNGVSVLSYISGDGKRVIRIDIVGTAPPPEDECLAELGPPIQVLRFINAYCTPIVAGKTAEGIVTLVGAPGFTLDTVCPPKRLPSTTGVLPAEKDACDDPPVPPEPFQCPPESTFDVAVEDGQIFITAPDTLAINNVVRVLVDSVPGEVLNAAGFAGLSPEDISRRLDQASRLGTRNQGRITIALRGPIR